MYYMETLHPQNKQTTHHDTKAFLDRMNAKHETRKPVRLTTLGKAVVFAAGIGVSVASIAGYNAINANLHPMPTWEGSVSYIIEPGDTVDNIVDKVPGAENYPKQELLDLVEQNNPGLDVTHINPGQSLTLPESFSDQE